MGGFGPAFSGTLEFLVHPNDMKVREFKGDPKQIRDFVEDSVDYGNVVAHNIVEAMEWVELQELDISLADMQNKFGTKLDEIWLDGTHGSDDGLAFN